MNLRESPTQLAFRQTARAWLASVLPAVWGSPEPPSGLTEDREYEMRRRYDAVLYRDGWAGLTWPREYGGRGATPTEALIFAEEAAKAGAPEVFNRNGLGVCGPTIASSGTREQRDRYLPKILASEEIWCQGFSEPN